jgi:hypothetical protein
VARKRTPGRWRRIPRVLTPGMKGQQKVLGQADELKKAIEERNRFYLQQADELEAMDANDCDSEEVKIVFLAERPKEVAWLRKIASISPEDVVFRRMHPQPPQRHQVIKDYMHSIIHYSVLELYSICSITQIFFEPVFIYM